MIRALKLGMIEYAEALRLQQKLVARRQRGEIGDVLLLLEHPPVITLGRNARAKNLLASPETLRQKGVELLECDRGGDVTFHGPGQLVGYPIFDLRGLPGKNGKSHLWPIEFLRSLEEVLMRSCAEFGIPTQRIEGLTGVWTRASLRGPAKIAAIGIHIARGVTSHGFALNVDPDLEYFRLIVPCGIEHRPVASLNEEVRRTHPGLSLNPISVEEAAQAVERAFATVFKQQIEHSELEELTGERIGIPMKEPKEIRRLRGDEESFRA